MVSFPEWIWAARTSGAQYAVRAGFAPLKHARPGFADPPPKDLATPRIDLAAVPKRKGSGYPRPFDAPCALRTRQRLGDAGDCAAFPKGTGNGHHLINRLFQQAVYLEVGSRQALDLATCSDIDMMSANADGRFVHKDGRAYGE